MRQMKESGVSFIGKIPNTWNITRNKNVFLCNKELVGEKSFTTQLLSLTTKGVKEKDINNPEGKLPESFDTYQYVRKDNIVMCLFDLDVSAVFAGISSFNGMISPAYRVMTCKPTIVPHFADYWFKYISDGRKFNHFAKNIRYTLNYEDFSSLPIVYPSLNEQHRIADYLDSKCSKIDAIIEREQAVIEKLKEYKLSVITEVVTKGLNPNVEMKDSGVEWIGEIPKSWNLIQAGHIITKTQNGLTRRNLDASSGNIVLKLKNITSDGIIDYSDVNRICLMEQEIHKYNLKDGDFLFVRVNGSKQLVGKCAIYQKKEDVVAYNDHIIRVRLNDLINKHYFYWYLQSNSGKKEIDLYTLTAAGQYTINSTGLKSIKLPLASMDEQHKIVEYLEEKNNEINVVISGKQSLINKLTEYKKSIIYEAVTGKKEV